jgi:8-oxo-dGTP diphosphatase
MKKGVDYIGVGIGAVIINKDGKILLMKRGEKSQNEKGKWSVPGGALEFGETPQQCIVREVKEETNLIVKPIKQLEPFNHFISLEKQHWIALGFICKVIKGQLKNLEPNQTDDIRWFSIYEAQKLPLTLTAKNKLKQIK